MIGTLERMRDRYITGGEINQPARYEERRHAPRSAVAQQQRGFRDSFHATDPRADQNTARDLVLIFARMPAGVVEGLRCRSHGQDDEIVDFALLLRLHPVVRIEASVCAVATRHLAGNLAGNIGNVELLDAFDAALAGSQPPPCLFNPASERRHQPEPCDHHASHRGYSRRTQPEYRPAAYKEMRRSRQSTSLMQKM